MFSVPGFAILRVLGQQRGVTDPAALNRIALIGGVVGLSPVGIIVGDNLIRREAPSATPQPPAKVAVPYVFGLTPDQAKTEIRQRGLQAVEGPPTEETSDARLVGKVTKTEPDANTPADPNAVVKVFVAQPAKVAVPYVFGLEEPAARKAIAQAGLTVDTELTDEDNSLAFLDRKITTTTPGAGEFVDPGATVRLSRAKPAKVLVPYVFGLDPDIARKEFDKRHLLLSDQADQDDFKENLAGRVLKTDPPAGEEVADPSTPVKVTVVKGR